MLNRITRSRRVPAIAGAVLVIAVIGGGTATAANLISSKDVQDDSLRSRDIHNGSLKVKDLTHRAVTTLQKGGATGASGAKGATGATGAKGDTGSKGDKGAKGDPGVSNLIAGSGYTNTWVGDLGETLQIAREECPAGQYALGGGFSTFGGDRDLGGDNKDIQITVSAPYFEGDYIPVDDAGNFRPTEWVVKGYNNGGTDQIVRAWVTCATISN